MEGSPIFVLSIGETVRLLCGVTVLLAAFLAESVAVVVVPKLDVPDMLEESVPVVVVLAFGGVVLVELGGVVVVAELSVCVLCVGVGAGAPVPSCVESVVGLVDESVAVEDDGVLVVVPIEESVVVLEDGVVVVEDDGVVDIEDESVVVVEDDGVVVVVDEDEDGVDIDDESVVVEEDGVVVVDDGEDVTSPVDVECDPSFETRM